MPLPLMPKATAVWLVENTALTFEQIGNFCGLHKLEVQAIADGEVATGIIGLNPTMNGQLTVEEIKRCEADTRAHLKMTKTELPLPATRTKGPRYTPVSKRADKPDAILYLVKTYPELMDAQVARLLGTTKDTIAKVREKSHWNTANIKPRNPVLLGLCKQMDLDAAIKKAQRRVAREDKAAGKETNPDTHGETPFKDFDTPETSQKDEPFITFGSSAPSEQQPDLDPEAMKRSMTDD
ncbi:MAG: DUF1013 domain-containing protein [Alphaproteobacteria bacterium]|nr:DUF1013 domain-containing protein [Alphaproteobacteria bacterium]